MIGYERHRASGLAEVLTNMAAAVADGARPVDAWTTAVSERQRQVHQVAAASHGKRQKLSFEALGGGTCCETDDPALLCDRCRSLFNAQQRAATRARPAGGTNNVASLPNRSDDAGITEANQRLLVIRALAAAVAASDSTTAPDAWTAALAARDRQVRPTGATVDSDPAPDAWTAALSQRHQQVHSTAARIGDDSVAWSLYRHQLLQGAACPGTT